MRVSNKAFMALVLCLGMLLGVSSSVAQEMTMDEYEAELATWQQRKEAAQTSLDDCQAAKTDLNSQLEDVQAQIDQTWADIYAEIGTDEAAVKAFMDELKAMDAKADGLLALSPEELFDRRDEITALEEQLAEAKENRISALTEAQNMIATIEGKLTQLNSKLPKASYDDYSVVVGDYLWKISGKSEIYGDPMQWMKIYSVNKEQIKDPDLIYPEQIFKILRGKGDDQYIVAKGDFLQKIAANPEVLGDPASWTKIYEKNKEIIGDDQNMIFPHTVLVIPE